MWSKFCDHTKKVEEYQKKDGLVEDVVEEILINFGSESDEELEPDDDDHQHLHAKSAQLPPPPVGEKPCCS